MYFAIPEEVRRSACSTHYNGTFAADVNHYIYIPPLKALPVSLTVCMWMIQRQQWRNTNNTVDGDALMQQCAVVVSTIYPAMDQSSIDTYHIVEHYTFESKLYFYRLTDSLISPWLSTCNLSVHTFETDFS